MKSTCFSYKLFTSGWWLATLIRSAIHFTLCEQTGVGWLYDYSRVQYHKMILLAVNKHLNDLHLWHGTRSERKSVRYKLRRGVQDYTDVACVYSVVPPKALFASIHPFEADMHFVQDLPRNSSISNYSLNTDVNTFPLVSFQYWFQN